MRINMGAQAEAVRRVRALLRVGIMLAATLALAGGAAAQGSAPPANATWPEARPADVASIHSIILATYDAISSNADGHPDMKRFQSLFIPQAQLIDVSYRDGKPAMTVRSIQEFVDLVSGMKGRQGRYEREVARRTERYGNLAQVWSSNVYGYENESKPAGHGINSITLTWDGKRWWIIGASWKNETPGQPVPARYLSHAKK